MTSPYYGREPPQRTNVDTLYLLINIITNNMNKTIIAIIITIIIAGSGGYMFGKSSMDTDPTALTKEREEAISMMRRQSLSVKQMGTMMQLNGKTMQEMAEKYKDATMMSTGKDLEAVGAKYMQEDATAQRSGTMNQMMQK